MSPRILTRSEHGVSRKNIDPDAIRVLYRLKNSGFKAYLVGGGVRDLLLGRTPKDFDVGTDAVPQQVKRLFRNCFIIGRRFRLCHVRFGEAVVEVATFRRKTEPEEGDTMVRRDNTWGSPEEDAFRRDFTINALFYDIANFSVIDYTGGIEDLNARVVRVIGNPDDRFREDPVRMMRAVAIAARLDFSIDPDAAESIRAHRGEIVKSSPVRVLEEIYKILRQGAARTTFERLYETGLLAYIFPEAYEALARGDDKLPRALDRLDEFRRRGGSPHDLTNAILIAHLIGPLQISFRSALTLASRRRVPQAAANGVNEWGDPETPDFTPPSAPDPDAEEQEIEAEIAEFGDPDAAEAEAPEGPRSLSLPFARRDIEKLRVLVVLGGRLLQTAAPELEKRLASRPFFAEALLLAQLDGLDPALVLHWKELARDAPPQRSAGRADMGDRVAVSRPSEAGSGAPRRRRPRRRGGRGRGGPQGPPPPAA
jgi:poly(A) polymerase